MLPALKIVEQRLLSLHFQLEDVISITEVIESELDYQHKKANSIRLKSIPSNLETFVLMRSYVFEAITTLSKNSETDSSFRSASYIRIIAALAISCFDQQLFLISEKEIKSVLEIKVADLFTPNNITECIALLDYLISEAIKARCEKKGDDLSFLQQIIISCAHGMQASQIFPKRIQAKISIF